MGSDPYDAENHTISSASSGTIDVDGSQDSYGLKNVLTWGPNGHPIQIGGSTSGTPSQFDTLHWDGDMLLFTTTPQGQLDDIKIGAQGDILPLDPSYNGLTFYDRDPSGSVIGCHNATGATYAGIGDTYTRTTQGKLIGGITYGVSPCDTQETKITGSPVMPTSVIWWSQAVWPMASKLTPGAATAPPVGQGGVLGMPRADGLTDGTDTIQGVRTYDSNAGTWTTPDAYAGNVDDPASQKSYMWNGNDPEAYGDPAGYKKIAIPSCESICGDDGDGSDNETWDAALIATGNGWVSGAITSAPSVVVPSDASMQPLTQDQMAQIRQEVDNGRTSGFGSEEAAAYAAAYKYAGQAQYARICNCGIEEVGALISKDPKTGEYGFGAPIEGRGNAVAAQVVASITASTVAIWHSHSPPNDESTLDLESHVQMMLKTSLDFYTTMWSGAELWGQDYNMETGNVDDIKICGVGKGVEPCNL